MYSTLTHIFKHALVLLDGANMYGVRTSSDMVKRMVLQILFVLILRDTLELFKAPMVAKVVGLMVFAEDTTRKKVIMSCQIQNHFDDWLIYQHKHI